MICVGIDVAKDKHDCFIISSEGEVLADVFTIPNNRDGFETLLQRIQSSTHPADKIKVVTAASLNKARKIKQNRVFYGMIGARKSWKTRQKPCIGGWTNV